MSACTFQDCGRKFHARGLCKGHYQQWKRGLPLAPIGHYRRRKTCTECGAASVARSLCKDHYYLWYRYGDPTAVPLMKRPRPNWIDADGYVRIHVPEHPNAYKGGWCLEHRIVMERMIGRMLLPGENVHHINGVRSDNRPENLELWISSQPPGQRVEDLLAWAAEIQARYGQQTSPSAA